MQVLQDEKESKLRWPQLYKLVRNTMARDQINSKEGRN